MLIWIMSVDFSVGSPNTEIHLWWLFFFLIAVCISCLTYASYHAHRLLLYTLIRCQISPTLPLFPLLSLLGIRQAGDSVNRY